MWPSDSRTVTQFPRKGCLILVHHRSISLYCCTLVCERVRVCLRGWEGGGVGGVYVLCVRVCVCVCVCVCARVRA